jgi:hypothetical protein
MRIRLAITGLAVAGLLAGCSNVVDGSGTPGIGGGSTGGSSQPDFPTPTGATPLPTTSIPAPSLPVPSDTGGTGGTGAAELPTPCPHVTYKTAKLSFDCLTTGLTASYDGDVWPLSEYKTVEASTQWVVEEGAGHWGPQSGQTLQAIDTAVRKRMLDDGGYGTAPTVQTVSDKDATVGGVKAHVQESLMTLNPAWAKTRGTKVKQERLWIVALQVGSDDVSLWYTSVPDLVKTLWPKVPSVIASIKVV